LTYASHTLHNPDYEGEVTLSSKREIDQLWGGTVPNIVYSGGSAGVYSPVLLETDSHLFEGQIILAPSGVEKSTSLYGFTNIPISLDYALQTRTR
jgi:hypothetical protein